MKVVIITGMSGAGRSRAADWFEDQGYYCVDNIPPALIKYFLEMAEKDTNSIDKVAFVTDVRSSSFFEKMEKVIDALRDSPRIDLTVLFLEASSNEIVRRYNEVRRNHPLTGGEASRSVIEQEADRLKPIRRKADYILDTTNLKVAEMYEELDQMILGGSGASNFSINISSFGFKYGIPSEADLMFDVRFAENPYYVPELKKLTGKNTKVIEYVFRDGLADKFVDEVYNMIISLIDGYITEGKYHLNVAFGCTGGHHRSVAIADAVAAVFEKGGYRVKVNHRDVDLNV